MRASRIRAATHHAFAVRIDQSTGMLIRPRSDVQSPRENLDVVVLEQEVLTPLGVTPEDLVFTRDAHHADAAVRSGEGQIAFILNEMPVSAVLDVADAGEIMPQKSTYFYPKVPTGEVIASLREG